MSKKELKKQLYKLIDEIEDEQALNLLKEEIVQYATNSKKDIIDELTPEQLEELEESIREADRGETITYEEFKKNMDEWRTKLTSTKDSK